MPQFIGLCNLYSCHAEEREKSSNRRAKHLDPPIAFHEHWVVLVSQWLIRVLVFVALHVFS